MIGTCKEIVRKINEGEYYSIHEAVDAVIGNYDNCVDFNSEVAFDGSNIDTDVRFGCLAWGIKPKKKKIS